MFRASNKTLSVVLLAIVLSGAPPSNAPAASATPEACAELRKKGFIWVKCHGAVGDGAADDTVAIRKAVAEASGAAHGVVLFDGGTFIVSHVIDVSGARVTGLVTRSTIRAAAGLAPPIAAVLSARDRAPIIENLTIDANGSATFGVQVEGVPQPLTLVRDVQVSGARTAGIQVVNALGVDIQRVSTSSNHGTGIQILASALIRIRSVTSSQNAKNGIRIEGQYAGAEPLSGNPDFLPGVNVEHIDLEQNGSDAFVVRGVTFTSRVQYLWIENKHNGILLDGVQNLTLLHSRVIGMVMPDNRAIRLTGDTRNCALEGNSVLGNYQPWAHANYHAYNSITVDAPGSDNEFFANFFGSSNIVSNAQVLTTVRNTIFSGARYTSDAGLVANGGVISHAKTPLRSTAWKQGDIVLRADPMPGYVEGWLCTATSATGCSWRPLQLAR